MRTCRVIIKNLRLVDKTTLTPILDANGNIITKPNVPTDPDYVPPYFDNERCGETSPVTTTTPNPCNNFITGISIECGNALVNTVRVQFKDSVQDLMVVETRKNNTTVDQQTVEVVGGNAYFSLSKSITGDVIFYITKGTCSDIKAFLITCTQITTTQAPPITTTLVPPVTTTLSPPTTTQPPVPTTTQPVIVAQFQLEAVDCQTVVVTTTAAPTTTQAPTTTLPPTTTVAPTTTTNTCNASFLFNVGATCDSFNAYTVQITVNTGSPSNLQYGHSKTNNAATVTNWNSSMFLGIIGDGTPTYIFARYGAGQSCVQLIRTENRNCAAPVTTTQAPVPTTTVNTVTTTQAPTTTSASCQGTISINSFSEIDANHVLVNLTYFNVSSGFFKVYDVSGGTPVFKATGQLLQSAPGTFNEVLNIPSYNIPVGVLHGFTTFGPNCTEGNPLDKTFTRPSVTTTPAAPTTTPAPVTTTLPPAPTTTVCSRPATSAYSALSGETYPIRFANLTELTTYLTGNSDNHKASWGETRHWEGLNVGDDVYYWPADTGLCSRADDGWYYMYNPPTIGGSWPYTFGGYAYRIAAGVIAEKQLMTAP